MITIEVLSTSCATEGAKQQRENTQKNNGQRALERKRLATRDQSGYLVYTNVPCDYVAAIMDRVEKITAVSESRQTRRDNAGNVMVTWACSS